MKIVKVTVSYRKTKQVAQFEPISLESTIEAELSLPSENVQTVQKELFEEVRRGVAEQLKLLQEKLDKQEALRLEDQKLIN